MKDDGTLAEKLFRSGKPFIASIVPNLLDRSMKTAEGEEIFDRIHSNDNYYPKWAVNLFWENRNNPNVTWVQEGYRHCCGRCFNLKEKNMDEGKGNFPDPYHEHVCLDGHSQSLEKQIEVMYKGKMLIQERLGINPAGYCAPNHMDNRDTVSAAGVNKFLYFLTRNGFDYFAPGLVNLRSYAEDIGLIVLPETKHEKGKSPAFMIYYSDLVDSAGKVSNPLEVLSSSYQLSELETYSTKPKIRSKMNRGIIHAYKKLRDFKERI
jgi:hypothetical protein